jgi:hypothetical protein
MAWGCRRGALKGAAVVEEWVSLREFARRRGVSLQAVQKAIASGRVTAVKRADPGPEGQPGRILAIEVTAATQQWNRNTDPTEAAKSGKIIMAPAVVHAGAALAEQAPNSLVHVVASAFGEVVSMPIVADAPEPPGASVGGSGNQAPGTRPADATPNHAPDPVTAAADRLNGQAPPPEASADSLQNSEYYAHRSKREEFNAKSAEMDYLAKIGVLVPAATVRKIVFDAARALRDSMLSIPDRTSPLLAAERDPVRVHAIETAELTRTLNGFTGRLARSLDELTRGSAAAGGPGLSD